MSMGTDSSALYRLLSWMSPSYPIGAYTYSHGLEAAVQGGLVSDPATTREWISDLLTLGGGFTDLVLLSESYQATHNPDRLAEVAELAAVFQPTSEIALESHAQGAAFLKVTEAAWPGGGPERLRSVWEGPYAYPVVVGVVSRDQGIELEAAMLAFAHGFAANLISAAVRLVPLGQTAGQRMTAELEPCILATVARAAATAMSELGSGVFTAELLSMAHETQYTRLFRS